MWRPQFSIRAMLIVIASVGYLLVAVPYWWQLARIQYREHRIRTINEELKTWPARRKALEKERDEWRTDVP